MIAEIVAIGTELLMGQIADSDAQMLSRELQSLGIAVYHHQVVGDNPQRMREALALALSRSDLVITTGGLGPTQDDLSKEIAAELLGLPMEFDPESWDAIGRYFEKIGRVCPMNNRKQAMFAKGCTILPNACGTAPGCMIEKDGKIVVQLPARRTRWRICSAGRFTAGWRKRPAAASPRGSSAFTAWANRR